MNTVHKNLHINGQLRKVDHLNNIAVELQGIQYDNGREAKVVLHIDVSDHVYTKAETEEDVAKYKEHFIDKGLLVTPAPFNTNPHEHRVFCPRKWAQSFFLPQFANALRKNSHKFHVIGSRQYYLNTVMEDLGHNSADGRNAYFVSFRVDKKEKRQGVYHLYLHVNTAFVCDKERKHQAVRILDKKNRRNKAPFSAMVTNIISLRPPLMSKRQHEERLAIKKNKAREPKLTSQHMTRPFAMTA